jgi:hypothetical protein
MKLHKGQLYSGWSEYIRRQRVGKSIFSFATFLHYLTPTIFRRFIALPAADPIIILLLAPKTGLLTRGRKNAPEYPARPIGCGAHL